jgi:hypothetical protein
MGASIGTFRLSPRGETGEVHLRTMWEKRCWKSVRDRPEESCTPVAAPARLSQERHARFPMSDSVCDATVRRGRPPHPERQTWRWVRRPRAILDTRRCLVVDNCQFLERPGAGARMTSNESRWWTTCGVTARSASAPIWARPSARFLRWGQIFILSVSLCLHHVSQSC